MEDPKGLGRGLSIDARPIACADMNGRDFIGTPREAPTLFMCAVYSAGELGMREGIGNGMCTRNEVRVSPAT